MLIINRVLPVPQPKRIAKMPIDNRPRCEYTDHCDMVNDEHDVCHFGGSFDREFHQTYCMTDPSRPYASYRHSFYCPECGYNWQELLCEECIIEGPDHWGYFLSTTIQCPECQRDSVPLPKTERL